MVFYSAVDLSFGKIADSFTLTFKLKFIISIVKFQYKNYIHSAMFISPKYRPPSKNGLWTALAKIRLRKCHEIYRADEVCIRRSKVCYLQVVESYNILLQLKIMS